MSSDGNSRVRIGDRVTNWLDNPWIVLASVFFVFAILGVPLIWISKAFPTWAKVLLTMIVTVYTGLLFWGFWLIMTWSYNRIMDSI